MQIEIRPLNSELKIVAREELNEDDEKIEEFLIAIKHWIKESPQLRARTDDQFLVSFLRGCRYSLEQTKRKLKTYYGLRNHIPEFLLNRDPHDEKLNAIIKLGVGVPLPHTETLGSPRIFLLRHGAYDGELYTLSDVVKVSRMIHDIQLIEDDNYVVAGQIGILDLANVTPKHYYQYNSDYIKKSTMMTEEGSPIRQRGCHYINTPPGFENVFNVFKSVMKDETKQSLYVHGSNMESLFEKIPRRLMPFEYGGDAGSIETIVDSWHRKILSYRQYFLDDEELFGVDEQSRPEAFIKNESSEVTT